MAETKAPVAGVYDPIEKKIPRQYVGEEWAMVLKLLREWIMAAAWPLRDKIDSDRRVIEELWQGLTDLQFLSLPFPEKYGGGGMLGTLPYWPPFFMSCEEIARVDIGLIMNFGKGFLSLLPALHENNEAILDKYVPLYTGPEARLGCVSISEAEGGSDSENPMLHGRTFKTTAKRVGDEWVLNGHKAQASNASVADLYLIACTTDPSLGDEGIALFNVPADAKGLRFVRIANKLGLRMADITAEIYLDNVRLPLDHRVAGPGKDAEYMRTLSVYANTGLAATAIGQGSGALGEAIAFTSSRINAGKPANQHAIVAGMLADMQIAVEVGRSHYLQTSYLLDHPELSEPSHSTYIMARSAASRVFCADAGKMVCNKAIELMGSYGYSEDYHCAKYLRDVMAVQVYGLGPMVNRAVVAHDLYGFDQLYPRQTLPGMDKPKKSKK